MITRASMGGEGSETQQIVDRVAHDEIQAEPETCSSSIKSSSTLETETDTIGASTPGAAPTPTSIYDGENLAAPIIDICDSNGDLILNIRRMHETPKTVNDMMAMSLLARFSVSSAVLRIASPYYKQGLNSTTRCTAASTPMQAPLAVLIETSSPLLKLHHDDHGSLSMLIESELFDHMDSWGPAKIKAIDILMRVLHCAMDPPVVSIATEHAGIGLMTAFIADFAWALGCVPPIVPWVTSWLALADFKYSFFDMNYAQRPEVHSICVILSFVLDDSETFRTWSHFCVIFGRRNDLFLHGTGTHVGYVISRALLAKREHAFKILEGVLYETLELHTSAAQSTSLDSLDLSVTVGAFMRAIHTHYIPSLLRDDQPRIMQTLSHQLWRPHDVYHALGSIRRSVHAVWSAYITSTSENTRGHKELQNPASLFASQVEEARNGLEGLMLGDYRPSEGSLVSVGYLTDLLRKSSLAGYPMEDVKIF